MSREIGSISHLVFHHSASARMTSYETIRKWHVDDNHWEDIGYHMIIVGDGACIPGRAYWMQGAHALPNAHRIGVCITGDNTKVDRAWNAVQIVSARAVVASWRLLVPGIEVCGHRDLVDGTECPGVDVRGLLG